MLFTNNYVLISYDSLIRNHSRTPPPRGAVITICTMS